MKTNIKRFSSIMLAVIFILTAVVPMMGFTIVEVNPGLRPDPELGILDPGLEIGVGDAISTGIILICPEQGEIEMPSARVEFVPEEGIVITDRRMGRFVLEEGQGVMFME